VRPYNFGPGPAALPTAVLERARDELLDYRGTGMSVMELGHRTAAFEQIAQRTEIDLRELLGIPPSYKVLFLHGGAVGQFAAAPLNLLGAGGVADYLVTGVWSEKAAKEAAHYGQVNIALPLNRTLPRRIAPPSEWRLSPGADYVFYCANETIEGVEFYDIPEIGGAQGEGVLVTDMTSNILARPLDVSRFGLILAGAQKNLGAAGIAVVVVREDLLDRAHAHTPSIFNYRVQADNDSMFNTPPTFCWYLVGLVLQWMKEQGGVTAMAERNRRKAEKLYAAIDASGFYANDVHPSCRSQMNVPFRLAKEELNDRFLAEAKDSGLLALNGHRLVGGMRASIYNPMPEAGVAALVQFLLEFERRYG
jgi:phosphoserine aminotransferase